MIFSAAILVTVLVYTWLIEPIAPPSVTSVPVLLVLGLAIWHAFKNRDWGVKPAAFLPALWMSAGLTAIASAGMSVAGVQFRSSHVRREAWSSLLLLIPWGLGQQFALQTVFLREAQTTAGRSAGIVIAAALFAALHLPNPFLTVMTFAGALAWCWTYDRHPNILPLAFSHALLTMMILYAFDEAITGHLRVGAAYLRLLPVTP